MGYKIYTYANPFKLKQAHFWDEIKDYPHICSSQVLVEGLKKIYGREFAPFIYTIESLVEKVYPTWYKDVEYRIQQFVKLSSEIDKLKIDDELNDENKFKKALKFNRHELLDSIRFLQELNIEPDEVDKDKINREQKAFIKLYDRLQTNHKEYFRISETVDLPTLKDAFIELINIEIEEKEKKYLNQLIEKVDKLQKMNKSRAMLRRMQKRLERQNRKVEFLENIKRSWSDPLFDNKNNINKIVIHGMHRFNPMIVRFITEIERLKVSNDSNIDIIFLYNYEPRFFKTYETWQTVYNQWKHSKTIEVDEHDTTNPNYENDFFDLNKKSIGESMGNLLAGKFDKIKSEKVEFLEFDNNTSFANYVSEFYEATKDRNNNYSLSRMNEQFYASNNETANEILKVYYPEQFGDRHFLAYPIGQLILALYNMWNDEEKELEFDSNLLKECFNSNLLSIGNNKLNDIYSSIQVYFKDADSYSHYITRANKLIEKINIIEKEGLKDYKKFSFYSRSVDDIETFKKALKLLNDLAQQLFYEGMEDRIDFKAHFERLMSKMKDEISRDSDITKEEKEVIRNLIERFESFSNLDIQGNIEDLRESIHYYLKQKNSHESANWIVRNFEQIDGDILRSVEQSDTIYHFAGLSEKHMQIKMNDQLSWPLNEGFFVEGYDDENIIKDIVTTSYREYKNFLRYALFYGVYYSKQPVKLSFVKHEEQEKEQPYFLLNLLGIQPKKYDEEDIDPRDKTMNHSKKKLGHSNLDKLSSSVFQREDLQTYKMCGYRYVLDRVIEGGDIYSNEFRCGQYYQVLLHERVWGKLSESNIYKISLKDLEDLIKKENDKMKEFFPFWKHEVDFYDKKQKVLKWITDNKFNNIVNINKLDDGQKTYIEIKKNFIHAKFSDDNSNNNLVGYLHKFRNYPKFKTQFHKDTIDELIDFIKGKKAASNVGKWCDTCKQREICLESYKDGEDN